MEKQIVIKHHSNETPYKIKDITNYLGLFSDSNDKMFCNFRLATNEANIMDEISCLDYVKIAKGNNYEKHFDCEVVVCLKNMEHFLNIVEKYQLNVMIVYDNVKVFVNDNDGDFIIIDSNHKKFNLIKSFKNH